MRLAGTSLLATLDRELPPFQRRAVQHWAMAKATGLGESSKVCLAGDWNAEPEDTDIAHWAQASGRGCL
eukprot:5134617-Alexandrium_andersonii.AAC.1